MIVRLMGAGELTARCEATGLQATLIFKGKDYSVKGGLEQLSANGYAKVCTPMRCMRFCKES